MPGIAGVHLNNGPLGQRDRLCAEHDRDVLAGAPLHRVDVVALCKAVIGGTPDQIPAAHIRGAGRQGPGHGATLDVAGPDEGLDIGPGGLEALAVAADVDALAVVGAAGLVVGAHGVVLERPDYDGRGVPGAVEAGVVFARVLTKEWTRAS